VKENYAEIWRLVAAELPDSPAIISGSDVLSYAEYDRKAAQLAALLVARGLGRGSKIPIFMYNRPEYMIALYAAFKIGAIPVTINYKYQEKEVLALLEDCDASALVYPASLSAVVRRMAQIARLPQVLLQVDDVEGATLVETATRFGDLEGFAPLPPQQLSAKDELLLYTGGTTGRPKAVVWPLGDLLDVQMFVIYESLGREPSTLREVAEIAADPLVPHSVTLPLAPFMHGTAMFNSMNCFVSGGTLVILPSASLDPVEAASVLVSRHVTRLIVAGDAVAQPLADALDDGGHTSLPDLTTILSSGMRFSDETKRRLHRFGKLTIVDILASTEGGPYAVASSRGTDDLPARLRLASGAVVLNDELREIQDQPGKIGMLAYRGTLPTGYFKDDAKTQATYPSINGVRHVISGDYVDVQEDGYIELLGRGSSVVNTGGEKVYPAEVEEALMKHTRVRDAVVFGIPDARWGESLTAVVAADDGVVTERELIDHVGALLANYKKPKRIYLRPSLGRGPNGKIDLVAMKQGVIDELAAASYRLSDGARTGAH
jgi:3-oxocholest-4-en-26-oate---CoA ligase